MKNDFKLFLGIMIHTTICTVLLIRQNDNLHKQPKLDLPEEYKSINKTTPIMGYIDKDSILHIEFNNQKNKSSNIKFEWEGLNKDIPIDGNKKLKLTTNGYTVYLNPVHN